MGVAFQRPTLTDLRQVGEFANNFRWNLKIPEPPKGLIRLGVFDTARIFESRLNVLCESTSLPKKTVGKIQINLRGHQFFQPGIVTPDSTITLNFIENIQGIVHTLFQNWQESIWATNIGRGIPYDELVADTIQIVRLDTADNPICAYNFKYCFLTNYTPPQLSGDQNDVARVGVTLSYDDFYLTETDMDSSPNPTFGGTTVYPHHATILRNLNRRTV